MILRLYGEMRLEDFQKWKSVFRSIKKHNSKYATESGHWSFRQIVSKSCHFEKYEFRFQYYYFWEDIGGKKKNETEEVMMQSLQESHKLLNVIQIQINIVSVVKYYPSSRLWILL